MAELYIGVMSGTSLDGVDVALCEITDNSCKLLNFYEHPMDEALKSTILQMLHAETTLREIGILEQKLGSFFSQAIVAFMHKEEIDKESIRAIGLHGQTLWHEPFGESPFSMQLGDANIVVAQTGIQCVADFRRMDIANGGEGAPFAPAFHQFLFHAQGENVGVLNIGGMANITLLGENLRGWDTGCGNVLLDMWMMRTQKKNYDKEGLFAQSGKLIPSLLNAMLEDPYFSKLPPKSTGREYFNASWLESYLPLFHSYKDQDIQRTLVELTAQSIANDVNKTALTSLIVCGGGAQNSFLMQRLQALTSCKIQKSQEYGVNGDALEAMAFAWLAHQRVHNKKVDLKAVTGARKNSLLGAIYG